MAHGWLAFEWLEASRSVGSLLVPLPSPYTGSAACGAAPSHAWRVLRWRATCSWELRTPKLQVAAAAMRKEAPPEGGERRPLGWPIWG